MLVAEQSKVTVEHQPLYHCPGEHGPFGLRHSNGASGQAVGHQGCLVSRHQHVSQAQIPHLEPIPLQLQVASQLEEEDPTDIDTGMF